MTLHDGRPTPEPAAPGAVARLGALLLLALAGCADPPQRRTDDQAPVEAAAISERATRSAIDQLLADIKAQDERGWPTHLAKTPEGKPLVRVLDVANRTKERLDVRALKNDLINALAKQAILHIAAAKGEGLRDVNAERDFSGSGEGPEPSEDEAAGLVLSGEVSADERGRRLSLRLVDRAKERALVEASAPLGDAGAPAAQGAGR